ncbi:MAG: divergent polysaccharide deacetylase family protein [Pseudomonadota bacterium]|nr:divergent polysaccharide deacetylase family protein [Pseudomonadota bacterium]
MKFSSLISRLRNVFKLGRKSKKEPIATTRQEEYLNEEDDPNQIKPRSKSRRLVWILYSAILVIFFGGAGIVFGWVLVNAEKTIEKRIAMTPAVTVEVLADGETAPKNSSKEQSQAKDQRIEDGSDKTIMEKSEKPKDASEDRDALVGIIFPHITEETEDGPLPIIAADGRQPWLEYSRGFKRADRKPRIALIVTNLGLSATYTKAALKLLPEDITLSFSHVAPRLKSWIREARQKGHEVLMDIPMEPLGFPKNDPGRATLLTSSNEVENLNRLEHVMKKAGGYVGLLGTLGTKFMLHSETFLPILKTIKQRGLIYVDSRSTSRSLGPELASSIQLPRAFNNIFIDKEPSNQKIKSKLDELEKIALKKRFAVGIAQPFPLTIEILSQWAEKLKAKQISLAPITAVVDKQSQR